VRFIHLLMCACIIVYMSVLYAIVITCVCQCDSIKKLDDELMMKFPTEHYCYVVLLSYKDRVPAGLTLPLTLQMCFTKILH